MGIGKCMITRFMLSYSCFGGFRKILLGKGMTVRAQYKQSEFKGWVKSGDKDTIHLNLYTIPLSNINGLREILKAPCDSTELLRRPDLFQLL